MTQQYQPYPGPAVPQQTQEAPVQTPQALPQQPQPQTAQQNYAPQQPAPQQPAPQVYAPAPTAPTDLGMGNMGAEIAAATLGTNRYPSLPAGSGIVQVELTLKPSQSIAFVAELTIIETNSEETAPGNRHSWYQPLDGRCKDPNKRAGALKAQQGAVLGFILKAMGFDSKEAAIAAGWPPERLGAQINQCFVSPGPLVGRQLRYQGIQKGVNDKGNPIVNVSWDVL